MKMHLYCKAFLRGGPHGLVNQWGETLKDRFATHLERMRALEALSLLPASWAVPQLLKRFDLIFENSMSDKMEKERIAAMMIAEDKSIIPQLIHYAQQAPNLSWPIGIFAKMLPSEEYVTLLLSLLSSSYPPFDTNVIKRNREIIVSLAGQNDARIMPALGPHAECQYPEIRDAVDTVMGSLVELDKASNSPS